METVLIVSSSDRLSQLPRQVADIESPLRKNTTVLSNVTFASAHDNQACCLRSPGGVRPLAEFTVLRPLLSSRTIQLPVPAQTFSTSLSGGEFYLPEISVSIPFPVAVNRYPQQMQLREEGVLTAWGYSLSWRERGVS